MGIIEIFLTGISLAMDAFAVSICKGLSMKKIDYKKTLIIGLYFGIFQGIMPVIGYFLGSAFSFMIQSVDHWISFLLLFMIGFNMIKEALFDKEEKGNDKVDVKTMLPLAIATSIDALAVGVTFAFLRVDIVLAVTVIALVTFIFSFVGVKIGNRFGNKYETKAQVFGGIILIVLGLKILLEHLGIISFFI